MFFDKIEKTGEWRCQMAPGEDDTWHARCQTHRLHVSRLLGGGHVGVSHPPDQSLL